jgi:LPS export ABC transporter protein LptC
MKTARIKRIRNLGTQAEPWPQLWLAAMLVLLPAAGCQQQAEPAAAPPRDEQVPQQEIFDYRLIETTAGVRKWVLEGERMLKYAGQQDMLLIDVKMDFYREGEHFSVLTADSGRANEYTKNVHTWGNVVVVTDDGRMLETEELFFDNESQLIYNDVFDRFTRQEDIITGIGLEATPDLEYIEIKQRVEGAVGDEATAEGNRQ